jgi:hypothetical protein
LIHEGNFDNYRRSIVTKIAYLIGIPEKNFANNFVAEEFENLKSNEIATIIRYLCILRSQIFKNYVKIENERRNFRQLQDLTDLLDVEKIKFLRSKNIEIANVSDKITPAINVAYINQYLQDLIDDVKDIIPDWIKFKYIRALFLMPEILPVTTVMRKKIW